jgi:hypothetical protein
MSEKQLRGYCENCQHEHRVSLDPLADHGCTINCGCDDYVPPILINGKRFRVTDKGRRAGLTAQLVKQLLSHPKKN